MLGVILDIEYTFLPFDQKCSFATKVNIPEGHGMAKAVRLLCLKKKNVHHSIDSYISTSPSEFVISFFG